MKLTQCDFFLQTFPNCFSIRSNSYSRFHCESGYRNHIRKQYIRERVSLTLEIENDIILEYSKKQGLKFKNAGEMFSFFDTLAFCEFSDFVRIYFNKLAKVNYYEIKYLANQKDMAGNPCQVEKKRIIVADNPKHAAEIAKGFKNYAGIVYIRNKKD